MKSLIIRTIVLLCALTSFQARAIDIGGWLIDFVAQQSLNNFDTWNSGPISGPTYSQSEGELLKQLKENKVIGTPEQIQMLSNGPVYITKSGIEPVGQHRPYRFTKDGYSSDLIITFTSNMSEEYKLYLAQNAVKYKAVLVLRGLLNDSVEDTVQSMRHYIDLGAMIQIDPRIEARFGKKLVSKAPIIVNAMVNNDGEYKCTSDNDKKCFAYRSVSGVSRTFDGDYHFDRTLKVHLSLAPIKSEWNASNRAYEKILLERFATNL